MMLRLVLLLLLAALAGCTAAPRRPGAPRVASPLIEGDGLYRLRYNPPPCLADQPELHAEAETPAGWERVALASGDSEVDLVTSLLARFGRDPREVVPVQGELLSSTRSWAGHHAARVLQLAEIDPVVEPEEPAEEEAPPEEEPAPANEEEAAPAEDDAPAAQRTRLRSRQAESCTSPRRGR
jgi:hypothetical protein